MNEQIIKTNNNQSFINIKRIFPTRNADKNQIHLHGKFNVLYDETSPFIYGAYMLKHIVLVVTRAANYQAIAPFKDVIVFEDDVTETKDGCLGRFNINTFNKILFDGAGDYYILCSIGSTISNILKVKL